MLRAGGTKFPSSCISVSDHVLHQLTCCSGRLQLNLNIMVFLGPHDVDVGTERLGVRGQRLDVVVRVWNLAQHQQEL